MKSLRQSLKASCAVILLFSVSVGSLGWASAQTKELSDVFQVREAQANPELKRILAEQREFIASRNLGFQVGYTAVSDKKLEQITGERDIPREQVLQIQRVMQAKQINPEILKWIKGPKFKGCIAVNRVYDARDENLVPSIRFQQCGNCWAYSCIGPIECSHIRINAITTPTTVDLSEFQIVACSGAGNCTLGGLTYEALDWLKNTGTKIMNDVDAPDNGTDSPCPSVSANAEVQLADWGVIDPSGDISKIAPVVEIKEAICKYGPIACSMNATPLFQNFAGNGVFFETASDYDNPSSNHAVMIIGWDDTKQAWLMRNSWSTAWGDSGYAWIKYDSNNIGRRAAWVVVKKLPRLSVFPVRFLWFVAVILLALFAFLLLRARKQRPS
jgi:Papain family cysteine protease